MNAEFLSHSGRLVCRNVSDIDQLSATCRGRLPRSPRRPVGPIGDENAELRSRLPLWIGAALCNTDISRPSSKT